MANYGMSYDNYVSVEKQARSDIGRAFSAALVALRFLVPIIIGATALVMSEMYGPAFPLLGVGGVVSAILLTHIALAIVRFFGRNEENMWKADFADAWLTWSKWTIWPLLCGAVACALMFFDIGVGATLNNTLMDSLGYIRGIVG